MTDHEAARLVANAQSYRYDATLDPIADLIEQGPAAWANVHPKLLGVATVHKDLRDSYRRAVTAGVVRDDRGPGTCDP